jgi:hypothetical protein
MVHKWSNNTLFIVILNKININNMIRLYVLIIDIYKNINQLSNTNTSYYYVSENVICDKKKCKTFKTGFDDALNLEFW